MQTKDGQVTYLDAVTQALRAEMTADPDVFLGEDVGQFGGAFKVTKGFLDEFGPMRVVDTPIAESGFTGLAAGAALMGLRPVVEFQFADFISCAFDQIINVVARHHYRTGDAMPIVFRCPFGARLWRRPDALAEHRVLLRARSRTEAGRAGDARRTPPGCWSARSRTTTRCSTRRASTCTAGSRRPARCRWIRFRSGWPRWSGPASGSAWSRIPPGVPAGPGGGR